MNIKTQKLLDQIHELRTKLLLYTDKKGYNFYVDTYIEELNELQAYMAYGTDCYKTNAPLQSETYIDIQNKIDEIKNITMVLF